MSGVHRGPLPDGALLARYRDNGAYTDCYMIDTTNKVTQQDYIRAFYTSWLFKCERFVLCWALNKPSSDADAVRLASGEQDHFAAWTVEGRASNQLLMCDYQSRTRSWLMSTPLSCGRTRLYFGSAVVPRRPNGNKDRAFGLIFRLFIGFHKLYSRGLLHAARRNL